MAKESSYSALVDPIADGDLAGLVDVSDGTMAATGTRKKTTASQWYSYMASKFYGAAEIGGALDDLDTISVKDATDSTVKTSLLSRLKTWLLASTDIGAAIVDTDTIVVGDASSAGAMRTSAASRLYDYAIAKGLVPGARLISTTAPLGGGGDLSADRTLTISAATTGAAGSMSAADKTKLDGCGAGTYTPTATAVTNLTGAGSTQPHQYSVARDTSGTRIVTVSGRITLVNVTAIGLWRLRITLPIASAFTATTDCNGAGSIQSTSGEYLVVTADATNDQAQVEGSVTASGTVNVNYTFQYVVL